jgi:hypothetical protein
MTTTPENQSQPRLSEPRSLDDVIADLAQAIYSRKQETVCDLLKEFAEEIKRQAIEP